jgi:hypothetical protein
VGRLGEGLGANEFDFGGDGLVAAGASDRTVRVWAEDGAALWRAPTILPPPAACVAWPELNGAERDAAARAGLSRDLARRPAACGGDDEPAVACARRSTQPSAYDDTHLAVACDGGISVFERSGGRRVLRTEGATSFDVTRAGLLRLGADHRLACHAWTDAAQRWTSSEVHAFAPAGDAVAVVTNGELVELDAATGAVRGTVASFDGRSVTRLAHDGDGWLVGFASGEVRVYVRDGVAARRPFASAPVTALAAGAGLVFVGHANGVVEAWERTSDRLVCSEQLHGAAATLVVSSGELLALSALGDWRRLPLADFERSWCDLVHEVWAQAPARWEDGRVHRRAAPQLHPCAAVGKEFPASAGAVK